MQTSRIFLDEISVQERLRPFEESRVKPLAESMAMLGLQQPISVWFDEAAQSYRLIAGRHRLEAAKHLGWDQIDAIEVRDMSDIDRQIWEIDENLMRAELSPTQEAQHLAKRKELWAQRETGGKSLPTSLSDGRKAGKQHQKSFAAETADQTGIDKRTVNLAISRATIADDVMDRVQGTHLDKGIYLDALKKLSPDEQRMKVITDLAAEKRATEAARPPLPKDNHEVSNHYRAALMRAWNAAPAIDREWFLAWTNNGEVL